jgi:hypothetical protein
MKLLQKTCWLLLIGLLGLLYLHVPVFAVQPVNIKLIDNAANLYPGDIFSVIVEVSSGSQNVIGMDVFLDFDASKMAVLDSGPQVSGIQIQEGSTLSTVLLNKADNTQGHIDYSAGTFKPYPSGTFTLATIHFQALAPAPGGTLLSFSTSAKRPTEVIGDTQATLVTGLLEGSNIIIKAQPTTPPATFVSGGGGTSYLTINLSGLIAGQDLLLNYSGRTVNPAHLSTGDNRVNLDIAAGTALQDSTGRPLNSLSITNLTIPPAPPPNNVILLAYDLGPSGAVFDPPLTLIFNISTLDVKPEVDIATLYVAWFNGSTWAKIPNVAPANNYLSVSISHFSLYALVGQFVSTPAATTPAVTIATSSPPTATPTLAQASTPPTVSPLQPNIQTSSSSITTSETRPQSITTVTVLPNGTAQNTQKQITIFILAGLLVVAVLSILIILWRGKTPRK